VYIIGMVPPSLKAELCSVNPGEGTPVNRMAVTYGAFEMAGDGDAPADGEGTIDAAGEAAGLTAADGEGDGDSAGGEATGLAAGDAAGAVVAGALVGAAGAADVHPAINTTAAANAPGSRDHETKADTRALYVPVALDCPRGDIQLRGLLRPDFNSRRSSSRRTPAAVAHSYAGAA
jgi:hypothetical protein